MEAEMTTKTEQQEKPQKENNLLETLRENSEENQRQLRRGDNQRFLKQMSQGV